jgi:hypothetical protein
MNDQVPDWLFSFVYVASIFAAAAFVPSLVLLITEHPQIWFNSLLVLVWFAYATTIVWIWLRYPLQKVRSTLRSIGVIVVIGLVSYGVMAHFSSGPVVHTRR